MRTVTHTFIVSPEEGLLPGILIYVQQDHAFDFQPAAPDELSRAAGGKGTASLLVGSLQIEVGVESGRFLFVWGYHPMATWREAQLHAPVACPGAIVLANSNLEHGISQPLTEVGEWTTVYDRQSGWVRLGPASEAAVEKTIQFAEDTLCELSEGKLVSLWLRPVFG